MEQSEIQKVKEDMRQLYNKGEEDIKMPTWYLANWWKVENQMANIEAVIKRLPAEAKSILDVGCGAGELYNQLRKRNIDIKYKGIDIVPKIVEAAKYHNPDADITIGDIMEHDGKYDVVVCLGAFNIGAPKTYIIEAYKKMINMSNMITMLSISYHGEMIDKEFLPYDRTELRRRDIMNRNIMGAGDDWLVVSRKV